MKLPAYSRFDSLLQVIVFPLFISVLNWIMIGSAYWQNWITFGPATGISLVFFFINWFGNNAISLKLDQRYPGLTNYMRRAVVRYSLCALNSCLFYIVLFFVYWAIRLPGFEPSGIRLALSLLFTMLTVLILVAVYEGIHNFSHWQQSRREVDTLSKAQLQAQLDALRQQVNPHFLFNSLNSLIALIGEDPRQAEMFAEELSSVYRYLLRSNDCALIPLANELEFIQSYYHLLKTRHGESLSLFIDIEPEAETRQLPPLTLQLLIENAVKHNTILPDQPLTIVLRTDERQQLIVSNNLQRKPTRAISNGVGLSNILTKYRMLGQNVPKIEEDSQEFRVILPLI